MKKSKWFEGAKFVPAHVGVYEVNNGTSISSYQYWDGYCWGARLFSTFKSYENRNWRSDFQSPKWRGIKK